MKKKILIIEDESTMRNSLEEFFEENGYEVFGAADGEAGLELAQTKLPDLIILDIILPKKDGFEVLEHLKKDEKTKDIPIVLCTNLSSSGDIEKALALGATCYLVKTNYQLSDILKKVEEILNGTFDQADINLEK